jgi:ABC-2 type transport system permease protein
MPNLRIISAIFKKEFNSYFSSPIAYIFITIFLLVTNWLFFRAFFIFNQAGMREYFSFLPWVFLFLVPAVSMRMWAEEKKVGTIELLLTLPISDLEAVLGKFLASFAFLCLTISLSVLLPLTITWLGDPDAGPIVGGYVGAYLMAGAYLAIGLFVSSLTQNQIVAFIVGIAITFVLLIVGEPLVLIALPNFLVPLFSFLGLGSHFDSVSRGVIDSRDLLYYLSVIVFFLFLNVRSLESRKWK